MTVMTCKSATVTRVSNLHRETTNPSPVETVQEPLAPALEHGVQSWVVMIMFQADEGTQRGLEDEY